MNELGNHIQRRRWIVETAIRLIAREGLEAVTICRIASEIGPSTTAVTHYFADKDELLLQAFRLFGAWGKQGFEHPVGLCHRQAADCAGARRRRGAWRRTRRRPGADPGIEPDLQLK